ncbi:MAG: elongation factor P [Chloroflexi bacterium]|nr:elongation factor P [Chloroflexota bacterium]MCZ6789709.1 elongation factor P [Chloroflexota bacterium]
MVIGVGELRKGVNIELDGEPYQVVEYSSHKMQQRAPVVRIRLRELRTGRSVDRTFSGYDVKLNLASVEQRPAQYLYNDDAFYYFMDTRTYEQYPLTKEQLGDAHLYLRDQVELELVFFREQPIAVELPTFVELEIVDTPPAHRGDTAQGGTKPATLETGLSVNIPFFVKPGEVIRIDTRTGEYLERAN